MAHTCGDGAEPAKAQNSRWDDRPLRRRIHPRSFRRLRSTVAYRAPQYGLLGCVSFVRKLPPPEAPPSLVHCGEQIRGARQVATGRVGRSAADGVLYSLWLSGMMLRWATINGPLPLAVEEQRAMTHLDARPLMFIVSGPSGAGKGTALRFLTGRSLLQRVPTYTTRQPRAHEKPGTDYIFVDEDEFFRLHHEGKIFEYTRTYSSSYYGSPQRLLADDQPDPLLTELDPGGFVRVRAASRRRVIGIFVTTTSEDELRQRLHHRGQGDEANQRLRIRTDQLTWAWVYDYVLVNEDRAQFLRDLETVVRSEILRSHGAQRMLELKAESNPTLRERD
jgi:guanylate kinase